MSDLAFNYQGERFAVPNEAAFWRVRRIRDGQRGQLDVVRGDDGVPLIVPIDVNHDGFRAAVQEQEGRYRLDALNAERMPVEAPSAYVTVPAARRAAVVTAVPSEVETAKAPVGGKTATVTAPFGTWPALPMPATMSGTEYLLAEALRGQVAMFNTLAAAFANGMASNANGASQMMGAAADVLRAADGAAMPHRSPREVPAAPAAPAPTPIVVNVPAPAPRNAARFAATEDDEDDDDDDGDGPVTPSAIPVDESAGMFDKMGKLIAAVVPAVPHLVTLVRGYPAPDPGIRNAGPAEPPATAMDDTANEDDDGHATATPVITPPMASHMILIQRELGADGALFRKLVQGLGPDAQAVYVAHLCAMELEDAVSAAAAQLAGVKERLAARRARPQHATHPPRETREHSAEPRSSPAHRSPDACDPVYQEPTDDAGHGDDGSGDAADRTDEEHQHTHDHGHGAPDTGGTEPPDVHHQEDEHPDDPDDNDEPGHFENVNGPEADAIDAAAYRSPPDLPHDHRPSLPTPMPTPEPQRAATAPPQSPAPSPEAHMMQIARHLSLPEMLKARALIGSVSATDRAAWTARLTALAPAEAALIVKAELARRAGR